MPDINKLNDAWIASGQKVSDLNAKLNSAVLDDNFNKEDFTALKAQTETETARRDALKDQLENARAEQVANMKKPITPLSDDEKKTENKFISDFKSMVHGNTQIVNMITSSTDENGEQIGLTIPVDVQTAIHILVRQYDSLEQYVNVESVTTASGSRVYEKWSDITPLANLDAESGEIGDNDDPKLHLIKYLIHRYAGITTITNTLLKDTAENLLAWLSQWIAKKVVVTRNNAIISVLGTQPKKPTIAKFDDIKDTITTGVDPAIASTSIIITNVSGFNVLSKIKNAMGDYLLQPVPTNPEIKQIDGKTVVVIADRWLADTAGAHPFIFGDLKQGVTLFDREQMSLLTTNIGGDAFKTDTTKIRVIDRFDVQLTDDGAFVFGSFKNIADQTASFQASAATPNP